MSHELPCSCDGCSGASLAKRRFFSIATSSQGSKGLARKRLPSGPYRLVASTGSRADMTIQTGESVVRSSERRSQSRTAPPWPLGSWRSRTAASGGCRCRMHRAALPVDTSVASNPASRKQNRNILATPLSSSMTSTFGRQSLVPGVILDTKRAEHVSCRDGNVKRT